MESEKKIKILSDLKKDYKSAMTSKTRVDNKITSWIKDFNGDPYGNEVPGRSKIVIKDVKKAIKRMAPSIIQPFIASDTIIKAKGTTHESSITASLAADILNYQYNNQFDKLHFIRTIANVLPREGTVWIRTGWEYESEVKEKLFSGLTSEEMAQVQSQSDEITDIVEDIDGTFSFKAKKTVPVVNRPTAVVCKNEAIYCDPTAEKSDDCKFVIHEYQKTFSDIKKMSNVFELTPEIEAKIQQHLDDTKQIADTPLASKRYQDGLDNGSDISFTFANQANKKLTIVEYWGEYDIDGSGIAKQIVCAWVKNTEIVLRLEENPYPDKKIPFISEAYELEAFHIWGNSVADSIADHQKIHTAIMRGFIDNASLANNGQKFFRKGALDYVNQKKLLSGEKIIEVNDLDGFRDGSYNQLPSAIFDIYGMQSKEIEDLTGISSNLDGLDDATIGRTSSGVSQVMSAAQRHLLVTVSVISNLYKKIFEKWNAYNQVFLDEGQAIEIAGSLVEISKQSIQGKHTIEVQINVDSMNQSKMAQINMLLQQTQSLQGNVPPNVIPMLVAEMFSAFGKEEDAEAIRNFKPEPDPMKQQMMQLEMLKVQADIEKAKAETAYFMARAANARVQAEHHLAKIDSTDIDTIKKSQEIQRSMDMHEIDKEEKISKIEDMYNKTAIQAKMAQNSGLQKEQE